MTDEKKFYVLLSKEFSPDFGVLGADFVDVFDNEQEGLEKLEQLLVVRWKEIVEIDKKSWIYGGAYMNILPTLKILGFNEVNMSDEALLNFARKAQEHKDYQKFRLARLRNAFGTGSNYLVISSYLDSDGDVYFNRGKLGPEIGGIYKTKEEAVAVCDNLNNSQYRSLIFNEPVEVFVEYWQRRIRPHDTKQFWDKVMQDLNIDQNTLYSPEYTNTILKYLDDYFERDHVTFFEVIDTTVC